MHKRCSRAGSFSLVAALLCVGRAGKPGHCRCDVQHAGGEELQVCLVHLDGGVLQIPAARCTFRFRRYAR